MGMAAAADKGMGQKAHALPDAVAGRQNPRRGVRAFYRARLHWFTKGFCEVVCRVRLALGAPSIESAQVLDSQRRHCERQRLAEEYAQGYMAGWRECFETCLEAVEDELVRASEAWNIGGVLGKPEEDPPCPTN